MHRNEYTSWLTLAVVLDLVIIGLLALIIIK